MMLVISKVWMDLVIDIAIISMIAVRMIHHISLYWYVVCAHI